MIRCSTKLALAAAALLPTSLGDAPAELPALPFEHSREVDLYNQAKAVEYFEEHFYAHDKVWVLGEEHLSQARALSLRAVKEPVLALAAAQVLFMFAWFRPSGEIIREHVVEAAQHFERSISAGQCDLQLPTEAWVDMACDIRWASSALLYGWLAETEQVAAHSGVFRERSSALLNGLKQHQRYENVGKNWVHPYQINFNSLRFPTVPSRPFWDPSKVPLARFLEANHHIFKEELQALLEDPRDLFEQLRKIDGSKECLATPGGWETVRIVRYGHWYDLFCEVAPQTCALARSRPEITNCSFVNMNILKLSPNAHLKPHFGNAPRMSVHLTVIGPEPMKSSFSVGTEKAVWLEGRTLVFDDTYPHTVSNWGAKPRYVMNVWFCHPCDDTNAHGQTCPQTFEDDWR